ncbi:MAG: HEAT repeat domain-containing protein [Deltaproteobacteria bacterium]|nr:HEAT repeat domain-containing protein [Deltaproteobacteria bacterium]
MRCQRGVVVALVGATLAAIVGIAPPASAADDKAPALHDPFDEPAPTAPSETAPPPTAPPPEGHTETALPPEGSPLLGAVLGLEAALAREEGDARTIAVAEAIQRLAALDDVRAVPILLRLSRSNDAPVRLAALGALGGFTAEPAALARLKETLDPLAPLEDAAVALPHLLLAARREPRATVPCPSGLTCVADEVLLAALLAYAAAPEGERAVMVGSVASHADPRALPFLLRLSFADGPVHDAAVAGLLPLATLPAARARLFALLQGGTEPDRLLAIKALAASYDDEASAALLDARRAEADPEVRAALEAVLRDKQPEQLAAIIAEEQRLAAEAAKKPSAFDYANRAAVSGLAGVGAAAGGAAASAVVADRIAPGTGPCYGLWGACAGGASAAAIGWFGLGDSKITGPDFALALSTSAMGGFAGLLIAPTIGSPVTDDVRHAVYLGAAGQLVGLTAGTVAAVFLEPSSNDVVELDVTVAAANALVAGAVLSFPPGPDARPLWGSMIGATLLGAGAGSAAAYFLDLDDQALVHTGVVSGAGLLAGLATGAAIPSQRSPSQVLGAGALGMGAGAVLGGTLGQLELTPSYGGMVYETWGALDGGVLGLGGGLLVDALFVPPGAEGGPSLWFGGAAVGIVGGAASTVFFPEGVALDTGDLMLQPLFVAFSLYHSAVLAGTSGVDGRAVAAAALLAPAAVSAGLVHTAPFIRASVGDVLMVGGMMGLAAYFSSMTMLSVAARAPGVIPPWGWVLGTSLAMDVGVAGAVGLDLLPFEQVGWKTTYVTAVAAGTTLVLSLPGSLLAAPPGGIEVPDVLLASGVLGLALGLGTMPFIDFRVAPDWGLGKRPDAADVAPPVELAPTALMVQPLRDESPPVAFGVAGRF